MRTLIPSLALAALLVFSMVACNSENPESENLFQAPDVSVNNPDLTVNPGAKLKVVATDSSAQLAFAPASGGDQKVGASDPVAVVSAIIRIQEIQLLSAGGKAFKFPVEAFDLDLQKLNESFSQVFARVRIEDGIYNQIRLITADDGEITLADGSKHAFKVPSGSSSGLKLKLSGDLKIVCGQIGFIQLDFKREKSFVRNAKGFNFKPVIRAHIQQPVFLNDDLNSVQNCACKNADTANALVETGYYHFGHDGHFGGPLQISNFDFSSIAACSPQDPAPAEDPVAEQPAPGEDPVTQDPAPVTDPATDQPADSGSPVTEDPAPVLPPDSTVTPDDTVSGNYDWVIGV